MRIGVVLTPWFMNLVRLPIEPVVFDAAALGNAAMVELPAGQRKFITNGDERRPRWCPFAAFPGAGFLHSGTCPRRGLAPAWESAVAAAGGNPRNGGIRAGGKKRRWTAVR
ncbi:MAG: [NiFe]-hydrogenase assembly chaperone HybE [Alphaproteobacteria bacterium]|nr:[NiFe]-hydrogenase assembly chaperone HybE [Alphaproteobacteria bacterium]